jgi:branched-subunit amino acid ABC-type transport system permease component
VAPGVEAFAGYAVNGIVLASILALAALGLTFIQSVLKFANFAHGDLLTAAAFLVLGVNTAWSGFAGTGTTLVAGLSLVVWALFDRYGWRRLRDGETRTLAVVGALVAAAAAWPQFGGEWLGPGFIAGVALALVVVPAGLVALDVAVWRPLRNRGATTLTFLITSIGVALAIRGAFSLGFGANERAFSQPLLPTHQFGNVEVSTVQVGTVVTAVVVVMLVHGVLQYTRTGRSLRAVADDAELASIAGIDVRRVMMHVWILAGALAVVAGTLLALNATVHADMGWNLLVPIFAATILGGIGNPYGALLGALVVGLAMEVSAAWIPGYGVAVAFVLLVLALATRPRGLLEV